MAVDKSVKDLLSLVTSTLNAEEKAWMSTPDTRNNEPDAYTAIQNHFTQKNTDAIVKCASFFFCAGTMMTFFVSLEYFVDKTSVKSDVFRSYRISKAYTHLFAIMI